MKKPFVLITVLFLFGSLAYFFYAAKVKKPPNLDKNYVTPNLNGEHSITNTISLTSTIIQKTTTVDFDYITKEKIESGKTDVNPSNLNENFPDLQIVELLSGDSYCKLPCWGGIIPGKTSRDEAIHQLSKIGSNHIFDSIDVFSVGYEGEIINLNIQSENGIVKSLAVPREKYPIDLLLKTYGVPDEIYFFILDILPINSNNPYSVLLFYRQQKFLALYNGVTSKGDKLLVCQKDNSSKEIDDLFLFVFSEEENMEFSDVIDMIGNKYNFQGEKNYYKLQDISDFDEKMFYSIFIHKSKKSCINIKNPNTAWKE